MSEDQCFDIPIGDLNVSEPCLNSLRNSGFRTVGEIVHLLEQVWGGRAGPIDLYSGFLEHLDETVNALKEIGCWPESLKGE